MARKVEIEIHPEVRLGNVSRYVYSQFAEHLGRCIYDGIWVGEDPEIESDQGIRLDTADALRRLALPALRWPGGCFADSYHWIDGIGPRARRPRRHNRWWDQPEPNQFGTDEFMHLCRMVEAEPYICLNVGSGTVEEACGWVEYCNSSHPTSIVQMRQDNGLAEPYDVRFWGIGNENWGCGGGMRPEYYADLYRRFASYVRRIGGEDVRLIACGSKDGIPEWDERFFETMKGQLDLVDYIALHIYSGRNSSDIHFPDEEYYGLIASIDIMDGNIAKTCGLAQAYSSYGHAIGVVLDEWGTWYKEATRATGLYQQNTVRDALFAAASFHCFHKHAERLFMTNMAQTVNVLQALVLTEGTKTVVTPTYHVYDMFRLHRDGRLVACDVMSPALKLPEGRKRDAVSVSSTRSEDRGELFLSIINLDLHEDFTGEIRITSENAWEVKQVRRLTSDDVRSHNSFEEPRKVWPEEVDPQSVQSLERIPLPSMSITTVRLEVRH